MTTPDDCLGGLAADELRTLETAGREVVRLQRLFRRSGRGVLGELLRHGGRFTEWTHYPEGDAYDPRTHAQYYYHVHPPDGRAVGEHGHFHLFLRERGMPPGVAPTPGQALPDGEDAASSHLFAISLDERGEAIRLFTVNRWVTGDAWYPAADVKRMLERFKLSTVRPSLAVNRWITAMAGLFRPQVHALLDARDRAVDDWRRRNPTSGAFEDRDLEVASATEISVEKQVDRIRRRLGALREA